MKVLLISLLFGAGIAIASYQYHVRLLDWLRFQSLGTRDYVVSQLNQMFIEITAERALAYMVAAALVPFLLIFLVFLPRVIPGLLFGSLALVAGWKAPRWVVDYMKKKRIEKFNLQMVDALNLMANGMKSGLSISQAMGVAVEQSPQPLSQELQLVLNETKVGLSLEDALQNLAKRVPCEDVEMFVTSIVILKETGGNLAETFDTIVYVIRERIKIQNKISAMTAQGYYQGMMLMAMPPLLLIYFTQTEPGLLDTMFESPIGWAALGGAVLLEVGAYFAIRKVMTIDV